MAPLLLIDNFLDKVLKIKDDNRLQNTFCPYCPYPTFKTNRCGLKKYCTHKNHNFHKFGHTTLSVITLKLEQIGRLSYRSSLIVTHCHTSCVKKTI